MYADLQLLDSQERAGEMVRDTGRRRSLKFSLNFRLIINQYFAYIIMGITLILILTRDIAFVTRFLIDQM